MKLLLWLRDAREGGARRDPLEQPSVAACPVARCERCGFQFPAGTLAAVCPRCLESFSPALCPGGCWSCPLAASPSSPSAPEEPEA